MKIKGSYTIEAALIVPILLFTILVTIRMAIFLYEEIQEYEVEEKVAEYWGVDEFYKYQVLKGVMDDQSGN